MKVIAFNGLLFSQRQTGVHRYAREVLLEFDKLAEGGQYQLIVPKYTAEIPRLKNINVVRYGNKKGTLWEQIDLVKYLKKADALSVSFNNTFPILHPGMIFIHDICYKLHPEYFTTLHGKLSVIWHRLNFIIAARSNVPIATVSFFSKYQIIDTYKVNPKRITVIGNAWQHMNSISSDANIIKKYKLKNKAFFFTLGSISINKNTSWVYKVAEKYPQYTFVIGGGKSKNDSVESEIKTKNIIFLGYITNEEIKALMVNCKAFLFPSIYEGFGIPPLEALSQGTELIISGAASLSEVYRNAAHYIDPYNADVDLEELLKEKLDRPESVLDRYTWEKSAKELEVAIEKWLIDRGK